jgi:gliding motility-associated-like protein
MVAMTGSGSTLTTNGSATDNCYEITRTWTATDNCGNTEMHTQIVTVIDTIRPEFTVTPSNVTIECSDEIPSYILVADDNCDVDPSIVLTDSISTQTSNGTETDFCYNISRTWTVTDNCGNFQTHNQLTTIQDTETPTITCISDTTFVCDLEDYPPFNTIQEFILGGGFVDDNCSIDSLSFDHFGDEVDGNTCPALVTRTYHVTDMCGNSNTCSQIINVNDEDTPEFIVTPADLTINCGDSIPVYTFAATDNCDTDIVITRMDSISTQTFNGTSTDVCFEITRRWIATDNCGNTDMHTQILTVIDTIDPQFVNIPTDLTIECTDAIPMYVLQAIDNCDNNVNIQLSDSTSTQANNDCFEVNRTWVATDKCGNTDTFTQAITVIDTVRPMFTNAPADLTIECTESIPTYIVEATDNCDQVVEVMMVDSTSTQSDNECYTITRTWVANDNCGNSEITTQILTIIDTIAPVFVNVPADASIACTDAIPTYTITATDNCDTNVEVIMTDSTSTQSNNDCYVITRTWTATDNCGNVELFTHELMIIDDINPSFTNEPMNVTIECTDAIPTFDVIATDNCDQVVEVILQDSMSTQAANNCYEIIRTWLATDNCGNTELHTQSTTIIDTIRPVFVSTPANITIECTDAIPSFNIEATDNCDQIVDVVLSDSISTQAMNECYEISRTWTATDNCGNSETFTHLLTIVDDIQPTFVNAPSDETITCVDGIPSYVLVGQDNCDTNVLITLIDSVSNQMDMSVIGDNCFEITRTWRATDNCGNTDLHTQTVTMLDDIDPSITCPDDIFITCIDQLPAVFSTITEFENAGGIISDNCTVDPVSFNLVSNISDGRTCPETITREYSIADQCGNTSICTQVITVHDTIPPTIVCMDTITADCILEEIDIYTSIDQFEAAGGFTDDNCGIVDASFRHVGDISNGNTCPEIITRTYEVADSCGNISICESYIVVRPNTLVCTVESTMDETCDYLDNGQIIVAATGCTGVYTYDNGTTTNADGIFNNLSAGVYSITVTDDAGCTSICDGIVISEPATLTCTVDNIVPETCTSGNDGSLSVVATGGTAPYSYSLNDNTNSTGIFSNLDAGTYSVIIRDANDCEATCTEVIIENDYTTEVITNLVESFCDGDSILVANSVYYTTGIYSDTIANFIGCDSIINLDLTVHETYDIDSTVVLCEGQSITIGTSTYDQTGMYTDELATVQGCDSIINLDLTVHPLLYDTLDITLCEEDSINFNGTVYYTAGTYDYTTTSSLNCDSTITLELAYIDTKRTSETIEICEGDSALIANVYYTVPGSVSDTLPASTGCDSIHITSLIVNPVHSDTLTQFICEGDSILIDNQYEYTAGFYPELFTNQFGCDSTVTIELMINPIYAIDLDDSICDGDSILIGNIFATTPGIYPDTLQTVSGCDSILLIDLTVHPVYDITLTDTICSNDSISFGNSVYNMTGVYEYNTQSIFGCDSTVFLDLTVLNSPVTDLYVDRCQGETFFVAGQLQFETGDYTEVYTAANGCDSTVITHLTIRPIETTQINIELCEGQSVFVGEDEIFESGIYTDTLSTSFGCDSILYYNVAIVDFFFSEREVVVCEGSSYFVGGADQFEPGIYYDTLSTSFGCDSIVLTQLEMDDKIVQVVNESICFGDSILLGGAYQTTSNVYTDSLIANGGCDSIVFTVLDILAPNTTEQSFTLCYGDSLSVGTSTYTTSGIHMDTLVAHNGCDSIVTTDLFIRDEIITNLEFGVCFGDSIAVNGAIYTSFGIYTDTLNASNGCDSLLVIEIENLSDAETVFQDTICQGDMVMFGGLPYSTTGSYTDNFATVGGCDSISTLNLIVLATDTSYTSLTMCQGTSMEYNDFTITNPGDYTFLLAAANGCDSVEILTVETIDVLRDTVDVNLCEGDTVVIDGLPYTQEGWILETLESVNTDCDSLVYYNVSMVPNYEFSNTITICEGDSALIEGVYYTEEGVYTSEYNTQYGCDSIIITELLLEDVVTFVSADTTVCQGDPVMLQVTGANFVTWSPSEGLSCTDCPNPIATPDATTTYTAFAETCLGEIEEYDITVNVNPLPVITTELLVTSVIGQTVVLTADVNDFTSTLVWTNEAGEVLCTNCYSLEVEVTEEISLYYVTATTIAGCDATAAIDLVAQDLCDEGEVEVPNFITPNNDGANDKFEIRYNNIKELGVLRIYNRWGELVFETNNPTYDFWDGTFRGKELNPGVFVYYLEVFCLDDNQFLKKGNVTIIK